MTGFTSERYQRQTILKQFGESSQRALSEAKVLVIGAGGLGCPVLQYLVAAGVGTIGIVENDHVSLSNLHRQVLYATEDIGQLKITIASSKLQALNPEITIVTHPVYLDQNNCLSIIKEYDVIVDCTDNFSTRYMVNDACVLFGKPLVYGAVSEFSGQVALFNAPIKDASERSANYRDLFPEQPKSGEVLNCAEAGVLGVLPAIIGSLQATEVIKLITGKGDLLVNQLLTFDALKTSMQVFNYNKIKQSLETLPATKEAFLLMKYDNDCGIENNLFEIDTMQAKQLITEHKAMLVDVRELHELPLVSEYHHKKLPLSTLSNNWSELESETIIFICQSGKRSLQAVEMATNYFETNKVFYSVKGGILNLNSSLQ